MIDDRFNEIFNEIEKTKLKLYKIEQYYKSLNKIIFFTEFFTVITICASLFKIFYIK